MSSHEITTTAAANNLTAQLQQIGLRALPAQLDDFLSRAPLKAAGRPTRSSNRWLRRKSRTFPPEPRTASSPLRSQTIQAHG